MPKIDSSVLTWDIVDSGILQLDWLRAFLISQIKNFIFLHFISTCKKPHWVTQLLLRYTWFMNLKIWLAASFFNHAQLCKPPFTFIESISVWQKSCWFIDASLRYSWFKNWLAESIFHHTQIKTSKSLFIFLQSTSACKKLRWLT